VYTYHVPHPPTNQGLVINGAFCCPELQVVDMQLSLFITFLPLTSPFEKTLLLIKGGKNKATGRGLSENSQAVLYCLTEPSRPS